MSAILAVSEIKSTMTRCGIDYPYVINAFAITN